MIQRRYKPFFNNERHDWEEAPYYNLSIEIFDFVHFEYKIGDTVYNKVTSELEEAVQKVKVWEKLKHNSSLLDVLRDFELIAIEIEEAKENDKKRR